MSTPPAKIIARKSRKSLELTQRVLVDANKIFDYDHIRPVFDINGDERTDEDCEVLRPLLETVTAFKSLLGDTAMTRKLCRVLKLMSVPWGSINIVKQGDMGDCMYLVLAGRCQMTIEVEGKQFKVGNAGAGKIFGEVSLRESVPRNATVTSTEPCELLRIDARDYNLLLKDESAYLEQKKREVLLRRCPALESLTAVDVEETAKRIFFKTYAAGEHLWNEREAFDSMRYLPLVLRGEVGLLKQLPAGGLLKQLPAGGRAAYDASCSAAAAAATRHATEQAQALSASPGAPTAGAAEGSPAAPQAPTLAEAARLRGKRRASCNKQPTLAEGQPYVWKADQLGLCSVGPGGVVLEAGMLAAAFESSSASTGNDFGSGFHGQRHGATVLATVRTEVGWISRYFFHVLLRSNAALRAEITAWTVSVPPDAKLREMVEAQRLWAKFKHGLVRDVLRAAAERQDSPRLGAAKRANAAACAPSGFASQCVRDIVRKDAFASAAFASTSQQAVCCSAEDAACANATAGVVARRGVSSRFGDDATVRARSASQPQYRILVGV